MGVSFPGKKRYEGVQFKVISITRGISRKKALRNTSMALYIIELAQHHVLNIYYVANGNTHFIALDTTSIMYANARAPHVVVLMVQQREEIG